MKSLIIISLIILIILIIILFTVNINYKIITVIFYGILISLQIIILNDYSKIEKINKENCKKYIGSNDINIINNLIIKNLNTQNIYYKHFNNIKVTNIDLNKLFNDTIEYGKLVREYIKNNKSSKIDGLLAWNTIKQYISKFKCNNKVYWNKTEEDILKLYNYVHNDLNMKGDDIDDKTYKNTWEKYHFFLQLFRIPKNNYNKSEEIILRVAQIGYNIGQMNSELYSDKAMEWLNNEFNNVDDKVLYFVTNNCQLTIN